MSHPTSDPAATLPSYILDSLAFERTQWAGPSVYSNPFYTTPPPPDAASAQPGSLLHLESSTQTSDYTLPPGTGLSRFIYQSVTSTGARLPVSAYILWPFCPRISPLPFGSSASSSGGDGKSYCNIVAWAHGTSSVTPNGAPSNQKNLWQHYLAPFNLALQGYVVVATDYAGLGVPWHYSSSASPHSGKDGDRKPIVHRYLQNVDHANDVFYSLQAAKQAFPEKLGGSRFVIAGHSQGGGAAWGCAQRQAMEGKAVEGYLGAVAISPVTRLTNLGRGEGAEEPFPPQVTHVLGTAISPGVKDMFPDFRIEDVLTEEGASRLQRVLDLSGCLGTNMTLLAGIVGRKGAEKEPLLREGWDANEYVRKYAEAAENGGKPVAGPLLVVHGTADPVLLYDEAVRATRTTAKKYPDAQLALVGLKGITHNTACTAGQHLWMDWIRERFEGVEAPRGLKEAVVDGVHEVQGEMNWWVAPATRGFHTP